MFADDVSLAFRLFGRHIGVVMRLFRKWRGACGFSLKIGKCSVVMGTEEKERYEAALASCPDAHGMQLVTHAVFFLDQRRARRVRAPVAGGQAQDREPHI